MLHPIISSLEPNAEQIPAIVARGRDVVVTAGAGTGKTRTLVARYLALLAEGLPARSVVAVTFTRKAAHEMRNRARETVRRYLAHPALDPIERERWAALYGALDAARIGTIHTLCAEILRAHPVEAAGCAALRVDPGFDVLDEARVALLHEEAIDRALMWAADRPEAASAFGVLRERDLRASLLRMLRERLAVDDCGDWAAPRWEEWVARLLRPIRAFVDDPTVANAMEALLALRANGALARAADAGDLLAGPLAALLDAWDGLCAARDAGDWEGVAQSLGPLYVAMETRKGRAAVWDPAKPKEEIAAIKRRYEDTVVAAYGKDALDLSLDRRLCDAMPGLARLYARAVEGYTALKQERQALDFDDLEAGALALLRGDAGVCARWQNEVRALLVDEFQDTNARQRDLLHLLNTPGGKLFVVGDAKQSIYAFRGADVTVFRAERAEVARRDGCVCALDVSYRAHRALVEGLNALLRPILGADADAQRPWIEPFAPLDCHRAEPLHGLAAPHIELHLAVGTKSDGALERAADAVAARLRALVAEDSGIGYGDAAILCRASASFGAYEDALERAGIPYVTVAGRGFLDRPEVRDVLNLLRALADPDDDLALAGALRSPVLGLSDAALYRLCAARGERGPGTTLWETLVDSTADLAAEAPRARAVVAQLVDLRRLVGRAAVADVLKALYDATDYPAALFAVGQARGSRNLAKLLEDAHHSGLVSVGEFLEYVGQLRDVGAREGEARALAEGAVQIMSIHAAKGLEFPVVVIGDVTHRRSARDGVIIDPDLGPLVPARDDDRRLPLLYRLARAKRTDREAAESARLCYVAATRAQELLLVNGCLQMGKTLTLGKNLGEWLAPLVEGDVTELGHLPWECDAEGFAAHRQAIHIGEAPASCVLYEPRWQPDHALTAAKAAPPTGALPDRAMLDPIALSCTRATPSDREGERDSTRRVWRVVPGHNDRCAPSWVVGKLVHEALAQWRFDGEGYADWATARARHHGLTDPARLANAVTRSRSLVARLAGHPLHEELAAARPRWHEVPYTLRVDGGIDVGAIDVLYRYNDVWTIVDIKTDRIRTAGEVAAYITKHCYVAQLARYRRAVEELLGETPCAFLCLLDVAGAVHLEPLA